MPAKPGAEPNEPQDGPQEEPRGIQCRHCHCCDLRVLQTRRYLSAIRRERKCRHCGTTMWTTELAPE